MSSVRSTKSGQPDESARPGNARRSDKSARSAGAGGSAGPQRVAGAGGATGPEQAADDARQRRRLVTTIKASLREMANQLSLLNHQVGARLDMRDVDLDCLDMIGQYGPLSPTAISRRAGLHPATVTGILDRLQRAGWITRERDPDASDRRAVVVRALPERGAEIFGLYAGMNASLDGICAGYDDTELEVLADFLRQTTTAGRAATTELATD
jgi:DNA-binding MarR family transcriptional regulator